MKYLIISADDFGMSKVFNKVILDLIRDKMIISTTVMMNRGIENHQDQIKELIELSKDMNLSIGLHLEFLNNNYKEETQKQFNKFLDIFKFNPSHIDIHKAVILPESIQIVADFCKQRKLPCRNKGNDYDYYKSTDEPSFHATNKSFNEIEDEVKTFEDGKYYEILFHPGKYDPNSKSELNKEREKDIGKVIKLNALLPKYNIKLVNYSEFAATIR